MGRRPKMSSARRFDAKKAQSQCFCDLSAAIVVQHQGPNLHPGLRGRIRRRGHETATGYRVRSRT